MQRLYKFLRLPATDRSLLVRATVTVIAIRVGLWVLPFRTLRRLLARFTTTRTQNAELVSVDRAAWAVALASRYIPGATCLTQALSAQVLLARQGCPARVHIGVAKSQSGQLEAHAWLESQGRIVIGGVADLAHYTLLPPVDGKGL